MKRLSLLLIALLVPAAMAGSACTPTCADDLDCPRGDLQCVDGTCEELPPNAPDVCATTADCEGGRICADAECRFVPSCQTVLTGAPFRYRASCAVGGAQEGDASPTTSGCQIAFALQNVAGANHSLAVGPLSGESVMASNVTTTGGDVTCTGGGWNGATATLLLTGCDVGGDTCDLLVTRRRLDASSCLADADCPGDGTCAADVSVGAAIAGRCR